MTALYRLWHSGERLPLPVCAVVIGLVNALLWTAIIVTVG